MENKKKMSAPVKAAIVIAAVALIAALCLGAYFLFFANRPLSEAAPGKWEAVQDGSSFVGKTERSMYAALGIDIAEAQKVPSDAREYLLLTEDGNFTVTVDRDDLIILLNKAIDGVIDYYVGHPKDFIEKIGLGGDYDGDGSDLSGEKIREYLSAKMSTIREDLSSFGEEDYFLDGDGDIIVSEGTYTVNGDRIDFDVITEHTLAGMYADENYVVASASSKTMTVKECAFLALNLKPDTELKRIK